MAGLRYGATAPDDLAADTSGPRRGAAAPAPSIGATGAGLTDFPIREGERAIFIAPPGYGKTNLIGFLLDQVPDVSAVIVDTKQSEDEWAGRYGRSRGYVVTGVPEDISKHRRVVWQVDQRSLDDRQGWRNGQGHGHLWSEGLARIWARRYTIVVFDEVLQSMPAGQSHNQARRIYTQGRKFGVGAWAGTQIGNCMDTLVARLAEHCFCFWTQNKHDLDLIRNARGVDPSPILPTLDKFQFAYHHIGAREWQICDPVERVI